MASDARAFIRITDAEFITLWQNVIWLVLGVSSGGMIGRKTFLVKGEKIEEIELKRY
ncbi:MAG: hypothetical protein ACUVQM_05980 [Candidatus Hadarchaeaceae archaeon]